MSISHNLIDYSNADLRALEYDKIEHHIFQIQKTQTKQIHI